MHIRKAFKGPTLPKRCQRMVEEEGNPILAQCKVRVYREGLCKEHFISKKVSIAQREPEPEVRQMCNVYKCFKVPMLNVEGVLWCVPHYMRKMKKQGRVSNIMDASNDTVPEELNA